MKNKLNTLLSLIKVKVLIATIIIIFFASLYWVLSGDLLHSNFYNHILFSFSNFFYIIMIILLIVINIISLSNDFKSNSIITKYKSYKEYISSLLKINIIYIIIVLLISFILTIFSSLYVVNFKIEIIPFLYNLTNLEYLLFYFSRMIIYLILLSIIIFYINVSFGNLITFIFTGLISLSLFFSNNKIIDSIIKIPFLVTSYFKINNFSSFKLEIIASIIMLIILILIICFLKYICIKKRLDINQD